MNDTAQTSLDIGPETAPLHIFDLWMTEAKTNGLIREPTAMCVATGNAAGELHVRTVLCKHWSNDGFVFFTNYQSQKGRDLAERPNAAAVFYWDPLARQIKLSGEVQKTTRAESEQYWASRPRESQLSQYISHQSQPVASREAMEEAWKQADIKFKDREIPCPENWGGFVLRPQVIEFWVGQPGRLHDRYEYRKSETHWTFRRLYP